MLADSDIRIRSLRIAGAVADRDRVTAALTHADWSLAQNESVLLVRQIHVGGALPDIARLAVEQARSLGLRAVSGWDAQAERAEAVRFSSRAELLACLMRDLLRGKQYWFWRNWSALFALPASQAIAQSIQTDPLDWPTVFHALEQHHETAALWLILLATDAHRVLTCLEQATGWKLGSETGLPPLPHSPDQVVSLSLEQNRIPDWLLAVAAFHASHPGDDTAVLRLACVTWLWQRAPQALASKQAAQLIALTASVATQLALSITVPRSALIKQPDHFSRRGADAGGATEATHAPVRLIENGPGDAHITRSAVTARQIDSTSAAQLPVALPDQGMPDRGMAAHEPTGYARVGDKLERPAVVGRHTKQAPTMAQPPGTVEVIAVDQVSPTAGESRFITRQGGWFLLLNVLALPAAQAHLMQQQAHADLALGWIWLYRLGQALGGVTDTPLADFLAHAAGLSDASALAATVNMQPTNPKSDRQPAPEAELVRLAHSRYGEAVCNAGLFAQPALALVTPSHLDLHFRMTDIRLDVRRAGLDIDPGWLPWLGRVVRFHYRDVAELNGL